MQAPNKYINGKIYKITSPTFEKYYIGSTADTLNARLSKHKCGFNFYKNGKKIFCASFNIMENDDYKIELIELYPCYSRKELEAREGYYQRLCKVDIVNIMVASRTNKQYYQDNIEYKKTQFRNYYNKNIEKINAKKIVKVNCICGSIISNTNKSAHEKTLKHCTFLLKL